MKYKRTWQVDLPEEAYTIACFDASPMISRDARTRVPSLTRIEGNLIAAIRTSQAVVHARRPRQSGREVIEHRLRTVSCSRLACNLTYKFKFGICCSGTINVNSGDSMLWMNYHDESLQYVNMRYLAHS